MKDETLEAIGKPLTKEMLRDAVHIAVAPAVAGEILLPGQHVSIVGNIAARRDAPAIGIVDPFLLKPLAKGERFFVFLYPGSITSLKHLWTHPAFGAEPQIGDLRAASEKWLRDFIDTADCPSYEKVMAAAVDVIDGNNPSWSEEYLHFDGFDAHGDIPPEFWHHVEVVLGRPARGRKPTMFSCSC